MENETEIIADFFTRRDSESEELYFGCSVNGKEVYFSPQFYIIGGAFINQPTTIGQEVLYLSQEELKAVRGIFDSKERFISLFTEITNGYFEYPYPKSALLELLTFDLNEQERRAIDKHLDEFTFIYLIKDRRTNLIKIGRSSDPHLRLKTLIRQDTLLPEINDFSLIFYWEDYAWKEGSLHRHFKDKRVRGEWFDLSETDINEVHNVYAEKESIRYQ